MVLSSLWNPTLNVLPTRKSVAPSTGTVKSMPDTQGGRSVSVAPGSVGVFSTVTPEVEVRLSDASWGSVAVAVHSSSVPGLSDDDSVSDAPVAPLLHA